MAELKSIQKEIGDWHVEKFGAPPTQTPLGGRAAPLNIDRLVIEKLQEETGELLHAHAAGFHLAAEEEAADVAIALLAFCARRNIDLEQQIFKKMRVNWCREWTFKDGEFVRDKNPNSVT